jgi:hypothetical protein
MPNAFGAKAMATYLGDVGLYGTIISKSTIILQLTAAS